LAADAFVLIGARHKNTGANVIKSIGIRNSNKHRRPKNVQVFLFSPINRRSIRKGTRINTGLIDKYSSQDI
jgi:hypothetical protein